MCVATGSAWALGLGRLNVQSALGETLRAEIDITSLSSEEDSTLKVRVASPDAYRAAGVDYNAVLTSTQATLARRADGRPYLRISSDRAVQEPFVDVILELTWASGRLVREYTLLLDPPVSRVAPPVQAAVPTAPVVSAAPQPATSAAAPAPAAVAATPITPQAPAAPRPPAPAPRAAAAPKAAAPAPSGADDYKVREGDTLYRIATRTQRQGVSLDQMLVSLFRGNPQAFMGDNMNRLKAGAVLNLPSADEAKAIASAEAREVIKTQSADFGAYRQRLAGNVPTTKADESGRQAKGIVQQPAVDDRKATAKAPDKLTLSQGAAKPTSPEAESLQGRREEGLRRPRGRADPQRRGTEEAAARRQQRQDVAGAGRTGCCGSTGACPRAGTGRAGRAARAAARARTRAAAAGTRARNGRRRSTCCRDAGTERNAGDPDSRAGQRGTAATAGGARCRA